MLILSRKHGESIKIGDQVTVTVISVQGDKVKLGIEAPKAITVHRQEVAELIAKAAATATNPAKPASPAE